VTLFLKTQNVYFIQRDPFMSWQVPAGPWENAPDGRHRKAITVQHGLRPYNALPLKGLNPPQKQKKKRKVNLKKKEKRKSGIRVESIFPL
jgi:hypothetical protein